MIVKKDFAFIRHGEHPTNSNQGKEHLGGLTLRGSQEARAIAEKMDFKPGYEPLALSHTSERSITTITLALLPNLLDGEIESTKNDLIASGRIVVDGRLDYKAAPSDFMDGLNDAFLARRGLEYLIRSDQDMRWRDNASISTANSMAHVIADRIESDDGEAYEGKIICAREFFYPSLRSRLIEHDKGVGAKNDYVEWYGQKIELSPDARIQVPTIKVADIQGNDKLIVEDEFASNEYPIDILKGIEVRRF